MLNYTSSAGTGRSAHDGAEVFPSPGDGSGVEQTTPSSNILRDGPPNPNVAEDFDWWAGLEHLSALITNDSLKELMEIWGEWRQAGKRLYFRGEGSCYDPHPDRLRPYPLQPSLLRPDTFRRLKKAWNIEKNACELERRVFDRYKRYSAHLIEADAAFAGRSLAELEMLCLSQHFGLPTRLTDWSLNAYVALYFALVGEGIFYANAPCRLWVMVLKDEKLRKKRTIHLESKSEYLEHEEVITLSALDTERTSPAVREEFTRGPYVVVPLIFTRRIAAQAGRFIYCPNLQKEDDRLDTCISKHSLSSRDGNNPRDIPKEAWRLSENKKTYKRIPDTVENSEDVPWERLLCYPISSVGKGETEKSKLLQYLEFNEFHAGRLFPDLSGWAKYIRQGFR